MGIQQAVPVDGKEGTFFEDLKTMDLSRGGIGFISHYKIPLNKEIAIELDLSADQDPVFVIGKVQWIKPVANSDTYKVGITFKNILRGSKSRMNKYFTENKG